MATSHRSSPDSWENSNEPVNLLRSVCVSVCVWTCEDVVSACVCVFTAVCRQSCVFKSVILIPRLNKNRTLSE